MQVGEKGLGGLGVDLAAGLAEVVEAHAEALEGLLDGGVVPVHQFLGGDAFLLGRQGDGHPVFVGPADVENLFAPHPQKPHVDVGGKIGPRQVPQMDFPVGVGQGAGDECPWKISCPEPMPD